MAELKKKRTTRSGHKLVVTNTIKKAQEFLPHPGNEAAEEIKPRLESLKNTLQKERNTLDKLNGEVLGNLEKDDEIEKEILESAAVDAEIEEVICLITSALKEKAQPTPLQQTSQGSHDVRNSIEKVKLPKLPLTTFNGDPTKWNTFWDSFKSSIHDHSGLADIDKLKYLQKSLTGEAAETISGLPIVNENYREALELLHKRFGDEEIIITKHVDALLDLPKITSCEDLRKLRSLYDKTEATVRSLKGFGISPSSYQTILAPMIMAKIPQELRLIISRKLSNKWDLQGILKEFGEELSLREKCTLVPTGEQTSARQNQRVSFKAYGSGSNQSTTAALVVNNERQRAIPPGGVPFCLFCGDRHYSASCTKVTDPDARKRIIREKKRCFNCLRGNHTSRQCTSGSKCYRCSGKHHTSICGATIGNQRPFQTTSQVTIPQPTAPPPQRQQQPPVSTNISISQDPSNHSVLLQTARATVHNVTDASVSCNIRLILDTGSQKTYITSKLRDKLKLPTIRTDKVLIKEFGNEGGTLKSCDIVQIAVQGADNLTVFILAYVVDVICGPISHQFIDIAQSMYPHLRNLQLADSGDGIHDLQVELMIGADFAYSFLMDHVVRGESGLGPVATLTRFGYVLSGPVPVSSQNNHSSNVTVSHVLKTGAVIIERDSELTEELRQFWDIENSSKNQEIDEFESNENPLEGKIKFNGTRYEVTLPIKNEQLKIPDNHGVASSRLNSLLKRLQLKPDVFEQYDNVIKEQLAAGVIEKVEEGLEPRPPGSVHYIPHHEVLRQDRQTTKLRIVYDASSKSKGEVSLNDCLGPGPNLAPLLTDVLLRFRMNKVAIIGDIEKAFLNISIDPSQRDLLRFLWVDTKDRSNPTVMSLRFARLVFGLSISPYVLNATIRHHLESNEEFNQEFVENIKNSLYVDDYASSFSSEDECFEMYEQLKSCFSKGGFNMRKWASNNKSLLERIGKVETSETVETKKNKQTSHAICTDKEVKVLGLKWDQNTDKMQLDLSTFQNDAAQEPLTKRTILKTTARFYDPLGLLAPVIVPLKQVFQEICKQKIEWDACLPQEISDHWKDIVNDISHVSSIEFPRSLLTDIEQTDVESIELHGFSDASRIAFGACVYVRIKSSKGIKTQLVAAKSRIAPLRDETIPRLELMAAVVLAQLITSVHNALSKCTKIDSMKCWSDSTVTLWRVWDDSKQQKQFIQNRVSEIRALTNKEVWDYCPTASNPADIVSRGISCAKIVKNSLWWEGPSFLHQEPDKWPKFDRSLQKENSDLEDEIIEQNVLITTNVSVVNLNEIIPCTNYSSYDKLLRITALVLRFIKLLKHNTQLEKSNDIISNEDLNEAKTLWRKEVQKEFERDPKFCETKKNLNAFRDEQGILRVAGRIDNAPLPYDSKYPVLLPRRHHFSYLVIFKCHEFVKHNGVAETLTQLRSEYWICKGRQAVKTLLSKCVRCKRIIGKAYDTPDAPPLPQFRVSEDLAFTQIAVDFAGPLFVTNIYNTTGQTFKCYIALFTCASTRAIHLELVPDLQAPSFSRALKRLVGRRGLPKFILSDNGKTFTDRMVQRFVSSKGIIWKFNIPTASWYGGFFESLVKLTKRCLRKTLGNARLSYEELETVLIETEGILNSRPLTFVYSDISQPPLTPSSLVIGRRLLDQASLSSDIEKSDQKSLTKRARYLETLLSLFFNRWKSEYLPSLREHHRVKSQRSNRIAQEGDIVCIHKDKIPRQRWTLGKITRLLPGKEGQIRAAEVLTLDNSNNPIHVKRPLKKLYPLEVQGPIESQPDTRVNGHEPRIKLVRDEDVQDIIQ